MGAEVRCTARYKGKTTTGNACLEHNTLEFRGADLRLKIPLAEIKNVSAHGGSLTVESKKSRLVLALGDAAAKWAFKIQHPPSRFEKLGVKPDWRVSAVGVDDEAFLSELEGKVALLSIGRTLKGSDAIFFGVSRQAGLAHLVKLKAALKPNGALWTIRPKGRPEISEASVMAAGKAAGLVDVKVVSFSPTHTAEKFVIPVKDR
jgi:hypothetical protein